jgi:hypothetical protein
MKWSAAPATRQKQERTQGAAAEETQQANAAGVALAQRFRAKALRRAMAVTVAQVRQERFSSGVTVRERVVGSPPPLLPYALGGARAGG